jgi:hypothetical protein
MSLARWLSPVPQVTLLLGLAPLCLALGAAPGCGGDTVLAKADAGSSDTGGGVLGKGGVDGGMRAGGSFGLGGSGGGGLGLDARPADSNLAPDGAVDRRDDPDLGPLPSYGVGKSCADDLGCDSGLLCLDEGEQWPADGYCTDVCFTDEECGGDAFCSAPFPGDGTQICIKHCEADASCATAKRQCSPKLAASLELGRPGCVPGNPAARDGTPCATFGDCQSVQLCASNPFSAPAGMCLTVGCTPGNDTTCAPGSDGICIPFGATGLCLDKCTAASQCRMAEGYTCSDADPADAFPGVCAYDAKKVGAACQTNLECGPEPWECLTGARFPGGHCGARACTAGLAETCPFDSRCYDPDPMRVNDHFCVAECLTDADCRSAEGYTCQALGPRPADGKGCLQP